MSKKEPTHQEQLQELARQIAETKSSLDAMRQKTPEANLPTFGQLIELAMQQGFAAREAENHDHPVHLPPQGSFSEQERNKQGYRGTGRATEL